MSAKQPAKDKIYLWLVGYRERLSNRTLSIMYISGLLLMGYFGWRWGEWLLRITPLPVFKVCDLVGQGYAIVGVILLTPLFSEHERMNRLVVGPFAEAFSLTTMGFLGGVVVAIVRADQSARQLPHLTFLLVAVDLLVLSKLVHEDQLFDVRRRSRIFGGVVTAVGLGLQLYGSYLDLVES